MALGSIRLSLVNDLLHDPLFRLRLSKATRPYFLQSSSLVLACRRLPEPSSDATAQIEDLRRLFQKVEHALYLGTKASGLSREHQIEKTDEAFKAADEGLRAYTAKYAVTLQPAPDTDEVAKEGWMIKNIKGPAVAMLESLKPLPKVMAYITLWPEKPRRRENGQWLYTSKTIDDTAVQIEKSASLNILLHQLLWVMAMDNTLGRFSLKQNPQFYGTFPDKKTDFRVSNFSSDVRLPINSLCAWDPVEKYEGCCLHLIIDRKVSDREIKLEDLTKLPLPEMYGNGWHLNDDKDLIVVREKGGMHRLLLWDVKLPPVLLVHDSSPLTPLDLEVPELYPGLTAEGLDKEWELLPPSSEVNRKYSQLVTSENAKSLRHTASAVQSTRPPQLPINILDRIEGRQTEHDLNDLPERTEEIPVPQDEPEDGARTPTLANDELSVSLRAWELHDNSVQGNRYSCPRHLATESPGNSLVRTNMIPSECIPDFPSSSLS
ncbi:hypothetical protein M413DRAFT_445342 [Hebeloma cylindrosporum]|uniref:Uncharacterized protein n=1 Tax=Hebeloma cylindrosporum TaxID=76867 RepID=A0A0C2YJV1_HEBCY|nr:hypothetical protein M413DRAFT_445342 [Hebeloma cylindrosporum h7]